LYSTCLLAIIRNLAHQVGLMRVNPMTVGERRQRNMIQALIMFPLPLVQLAFIWPLTVQRYVVGTLVGCSWAAQPAWPYLVFYVLPPVVFGFLTAGYGGGWFFFLVFFSIRHLPRLHHR
jgi:pheromone a factor receptor